MLSQKTDVCPRCRREVPPWSMTTCPMCAASLCHRCAHQAYGRLFCSPRCSEHFFYGETDESGDDEQEA